MADVDKLNIDSIIQRLLEEERSRGNVQLQENEIRGLCLKSREIFLSQPILLELEAPLKICVRRLPPREQLPVPGGLRGPGEAVSGDHLPAAGYKIKYPENFFLLRGTTSVLQSTEYTASMTSKRRYNIKLWKTFTDCFNCLPISAIVDEKIFCCHGGLSPDLQSMEQIRRIMRPTDVPDQGLLCDLLWSDPDKDVLGWGENDRGVSFTFGSEVVEDGYEFFAKRQLVTLFSAPNYCGEVLMAVKPTRGGDESQTPVYLCSTLFTVCWRSVAPSRFPLLIWPGLDGGSPGWWVMLSVLSYGRLVARAVIGGLSQTDGRDYSLVTASCGFGKDFRKGILKKGMCYGDDACFIARHRSADVLGVADGVGGWRDYGVDPSQFSGTLMKTCERLVKEGRFVPSNPVGVLTSSYYELLQNKVPLLGSSTACIVVLDRRSHRLHTANLGDSGFLVVRGGEVVHRSDEQQHYFNTPFQLSIAPREPRGPCSATDSSSFDVQLGDIILTASDGLFDNMPDYMILQELKKLKTARSIAEQAHVLAYDPNYMSPFA
ncbi:hypothetical protein F7725_012421, partial [Dissostichus mawsoni]